MKTLNVVCVYLHTCPPMITLPLAIAVFPLRNCPGLCFSAPNSRARGDFVISYKSTLHVLWWWVKIRTRPHCFEIPLSFEPLTKLGFDWIMSSHAPDQWRRSSKDFRGNVLDPPHDWHIIGCCVRQHRLKLAHENTLKCLWDTRRSVKTKWFD